MVSLRRRKWALAVCRDYIIWSLLDVSLHCQPVMQELASPHRIGMSLSFIGRHAGSVINLNTCAFHSPTVTQCPDVLLYRRTICSTWEIVLHRGLCWGQNTSRPCGVFPRLVLTVACTTTGYEHYLVYLRTSDRLGLVVRSFDLILDGDNAGKRYLLRLWLHLDYSWIITRDDSSPPRLA